MPTPGSQGDRPGWHETLAGLPPEWPHDPLPDIQVARRQMGQALVVLDDDPTGTQTVHGLPVLTDFTPAALQQELANPVAADAFYLLTNSRSMPAAEAYALNRAIGQDLLAAMRRTGRQAAVISRSDSTLRGHFPGEVDALAGAMGGGFDGVLLIPAFVAGGRYTIDDVHYAADGERLVPAGETEFARDRSFGYVNSNLRQWVAEKSRGRIAAEAVASISLDEVRRGGPQATLQRLLTLCRGKICVVNAASERDLAVMALAALEAEARGRRFLYRTAASFVAWRAGLPGRPLLQLSELGLPTAGGGLIVAGSYVPRTTAQLEALLASGPDGVEVSVPALVAAQTRESEIVRAADDVDAALRTGADAVLFTSRELVSGRDAIASLDIGRRISAGLVDIVRSVRARPRYVLAKGGITASDIATHALNVRRAMVLGQLMPGVPAWQLGPGSRWPGLCYVVFPGNVGGRADLAEAVGRLRSSVLQ
jgi:uncharacterized protein YgbK (DUF1537 family)